MTIDAECFRDGVRRLTLCSSYWEVTFNNPPINLIDPDTIAQLNALLGKIESNPTLNVVVFKSNDPDFFIAHYDISSVAAFAALPPGPTGLDPWNDVLVRLSRVPALTVAALRGRARGAGSQFVLACDVRFASKERAVLGQFEVGGGAVPGGGPMARRPIRRQRRQARQYWRIYARSSARCRS